MIAQKDRPGNCGALLGRDQVLSGDPIEQVERLRGRLEGDAIPLMDREILICSGYQAEAFQAYMDELRPSGGDVFDHLDDAHGPLGLLGEMEMLRPDTQIDWLPRSGGRSQMSWQRDT